MSAAKAKGTAAETAVVTYLREHGWPLVERRALTGNADQGDITGTPCLAWEVKNHGVYKFSEWLRETRNEQANARADYGLLIVKPKGVGVTRVGDWWAILTLEDLTELLRDAGYGDPMPVSA